MTKLSLLFLVTLMNEKLRPKEPTPTPKLKHHWAYDGEDGPSSWPLHYEICGGTRQSPIDIIHSRVDYDVSLPKFDLYNFDVFSQLTGNTILNITNNGHSASCAIKGDYYVDGGGLGGHYRTAEFHFHWGGANDRGSEHAMTGKKYPLEMHIVNYAEKYGNLSSAMKEPDGLAVLGVFFELSPNDNPHLEPITSALGKIIHDGDYEVINNCSVRNLLPNDLGSYYRYEGSLTTPPCYQSVIWTVFAETQTISERQLAALRKLEQHQHNTHDSHGHKVQGRKFMVDNFRPLQLINGRRVTKSFSGAFAKNSPTRFSAPLTFVQPGGVVGPRPGQQTQFGTSAGSGSPGSPSDGSFKGQGTIFSEIMDAQSKQGIIVSEANSRGPSIQSGDAKAASIQTQRSMREMNTNVKLPSADTIGPSQRLVKPTTSTPPVYPSVTLINPKFLPSMIAGDNRQSSGSSFSSPSSSRPSALIQPETAPNPYVRTDQRIITSGALEKPTQSQQAAGSQKLQAPNAPRVVYTPSTNGRQQGRSSWVQNHAPRQTNNRQSVTSTRHPQHNQYPQVYNYQYPSPAQSAPPVYLQQVPEPVRVRKPYFYNYYMNRNAPAAQPYTYPNNNYDALNYGVIELKKRKKRTSRHKISKHHIHDENCRH